MPSFNLNTAKRKSIVLNAETEAAVKHVSNSDSCFDLILKQINNGKIYERYLLNKENLIVLDVGANVGLFSLYAHDVCRKLFSIEPTPSHFDLLKGFCAGYDNIELHNLAVSNVNGQTDFYLENGNTTMNSLVKRAASAQKKISIQCVRLDDFVKDVVKEKVDFAKIDIEGSEYVALSEEIVSNLSSLVRSVFVEVHTQERSFDGAVSLFRARFEKFGYKTERHGVDGVFAWRNDE